MKKETGITLIALIVIIVILIILSSVSIAMLTGEDGIIAKASEAKLQSKRASIKELIDITVLKQRTINPFGEDIEILQSSKGELEADNSKELRKYGKEIEIKDIISIHEDSYFYVIVDKDVYKVTAEETTYEYSQGNNDIILEEGDIKYTYTPSDWTNEKVKVKIEVNTNKIAEYVIKYKIGNEENWTNYTNEIEVEKNCNIYSKLEGINGQSSVATGTVTNIDRLKPKDFIPTATSTDTTVTIKGSTTDQEKTSEDACSGISKYYFSIDNGGHWEPEGGQTDDTYTFKGLQSGSFHSGVRMKAVDSAGNETESERIEILLKRTYSVSYNANGGEKAPSSQTKIEGIPLILTSEQPTRLGYTFKGWGRRSTSTDVLYMPGDTYSSDSNTTLYAIWEIGTLTFSNGTYKHIEALYNKETSVTWTTKVALPKGSKITLKLKDDHTSNRWYKFLLEI